ncbi:DUF6515 family protein [uncultured Microbulbifer sp.]|uniref:DUF6515 family protein n=1 Tax=uncultured Microbulbifer sp. TaxID=348147 RepID=UPI00262706CB|nr:DUF6515 family protein [uncultured Microbulbifer sp.]
MKRLITAITTAGLLLATGPALADRDDRHHRNDHNRKFVQQQDRNKQHHTKIRDMENKRRDAHNRRLDRENAREDRRKNHKGKDDRQDKQHGKDKHKYLKYAGYDRRYDKNRNDRKQAHGGHKPHRPAHRPSHKPHRPHHRPHKHRWRPKHYGYGYRWKRLPKSYISLTFGGLGYYFSDGVFYRPNGAGYVVAQAPVGAFVRTLPGTAMSVSFNGLNYFVAYDTYYRWDHRRNGYLVVHNPGFL